jgi:hypothetical protein
VGPYGQGHEKRISVRFVSILKTFENARVVVLMASGVSSIIVDNVIQPSLINFVHVEISIYATVDMYLHFSYRNVSFPSKNSMYISSVIVLLQRRHVNWAFRRS